MQRLAKIIVEKSKQTSYNLLEGVTEGVEKENFDKPE